MQVVFLEGACRWFPTDITKAGIPMPGAAVPLDYRRQYRRQFRRALDTLEHPQRCALA